MELTLSKRWNAVVVLFAAAAVLGGWDCGSSGSTDGGTPPPSSTALCDLQSVFTGPCLLTLTGDVNATGACKPVYVVFDPANGPLGTSSMIQIGASSVRGSDAAVVVQSVDITLEWTGLPPDGGTPTLVADTSAAHSNSVLVFLNDPGNTPFWALTGIPDAGSMAFTIKKALPAPALDGGGRSFWCVNGTVTADVVDLYNPGRIIHLVADFDGGA